MPTERELRELSRFDLRNDLAVQAAKQLDAKIEEAVCAAFDDGKDFVRSAELTYDPPDYFEPRPIFEPWVHTISYKAGPIDPAAPTPIDFVRYTRPAKWRKGQSLRGYL